MATKTSPSRRSSRASTKRRSTSSRKRPARRPAKKKAPPKTPVHQILSPHARDALGIFLCVLALVAVLGLWFDAAGPVGDFLGWAFRGAWGVAAITFPLIGIYWGILLLRDTAREDRVRMFIGFTVLGLGILGLLSLLGGNPAATAGYEAVAHAGGMVGTLVARPLSSVISPIGAAIVCLGFAMLGALIFTGTPIAAVWATLHDFFTAADVEDQPVEPDEAPVHIGFEAPPTEAEPPALKKERLRHIKEAFGLVAPDGDDGVSVPEAAWDLPDDEASVFDGDTQDEGFDEDEDEDEDAVSPARGRAAAPSDGSYQLPPLDLLREAPPANADHADQEQMQEALERTLRTFGVDARVTGAH